MDKIYEDIQTYTPVSPANLLEYVSKKREEGKRLLQLFATHLEDHYQILYCFDEGDYKLDNLRLLAEYDDVIPSVSKYYPYATPYENEAIELYGVKIDVPEDGFNHKLYKIQEEAPFVSDFER